LYDNGFVLRDEFTKSQKTGLPERYRPLPTASVVASRENPTKDSEKTMFPLKVARISKAFGSRVLFQSVSLEISKGESVALIGESGSGKSTLLNLIAGLDRPDDGQIEIAGQAIQGLVADDSAKLRREHIGFVFQAFHLLPHLNATQNVALALLLNNVPAPTAKLRSEALLAQLGLIDQSKAMPAQLSGGEQQRVALARALVHRPTLVLADEPTGNLDTETARQALDLMFAACAEQGSSLLMVTHSDAAAARCQRVLRLTTTGLR
jgi:putative ABC transport system ATP-binding protein